MTGIETSTLVYVNNISGIVSSTGKASNIDAPGFYYFNGSKWAKINSGKGTATTSLYYLADDHAGFLASSFLGDSQAIPFSISLEAADGVTYDVANSKITINKDGYYKFIFSYSADHNTNCNTPSYFMDFFDNDGNPVRIMSTAAIKFFGSGVGHGGNIIYSSRLKKGTNWFVRLGRGNSGDCTGAGLTLKKGGTTLEITSIGY